MKFDLDKLNTYKNLIQTTNLQEGYQEFIKLFRYLRVELEKELSEFNFSSSIVENRMDFSYFHLTSKELKDNGLKVQVVFVHKDHDFEVWISGYNRKVQCEYNDKLNNREMDYILNQKPKEDDYILKTKIVKEVDISDGDALIAELKNEIYKIIEFVLT